jgi:hypothetical protein
VESLDYMIIPHMLVTYRTTVLNVSQASLVRSTQAITEGRLHSGVEVGAVREQDGVAEIPGEPWSSTADGARPPGWGIYLAYGLQFEWLISCWRHAALRPGRSGSDDDDA